MNEFLKEKLKGKSKEQAREILDKYTKDLIPEEFEKLKQGINSSKLIDETSKASKPTNDYGKVIQREHDISSFKRDTGSSPKIEDISTEKNPDSKFDITKKAKHDYGKVIAPGIAKQYPSKLKTVAKVMGKVGSKLPVVGGIMAAVANKDLMAAVPVLGSADEVGRGSDVVPNPKSPEEKLALKKEIEANFAESYKRAKNYKRQPSIMEMIKERLNRK